MTYKAGAAYVSVTPDLRGFHESIGRQLDRENVTFAKAGETWGKKAAAGFRTGFRPDPVVKPKVDDAAARTQLDGLARDRTATVDADADTAKADAQLDRAARNRTAKIEVSLSGLAGAGAALAAIGLGPAAAGLGLAGAGLGVAGGAAAIGGGLFGLLAKNEISQIKQQSKDYASASKQVTSAQAALEKSQAGVTAASDRSAAASTKAGKASAAAGVASAKAGEQAAQSKLTAALAAQAKAANELSPAEKELAREITGLQSAWSSFQRSESKFVAPALSPWIAAATEGLKYLPNIVNPAAKAIGYLGDEAKTALAAPFWGTFSKDLGRLGGESLKDFGEAAGHVASGLAHLFVTFEPDLQKLPPLVDKAAASFDRWASGVKAGPLEDFFKKTFSPSNVATLKSDLSALGTTLENVGKAVAGISPAAFSGLNTLLTIISKLTPAEITAIGLIFGASKVAGAVSGTAGLVKLVTGAGSVFGLGGAAKAAGAAGAAGEAAGLAGKISGFARVAGPAAGLIGTGAGIAIPAWMAPRTATTGGRWADVGRGALGGAAIGAGIGMFAGPAGAAIGAGAGALIGGSISAVRQFAPELRKAGMSLAHALGAGWSSASGWVSSQFRRARDWTVSALRTANTWATAPGRLAAQGLGKAWTAASGWVISQFGRARGWAQGALRSAGSWLVSHGKSAAAGLGAGWNASQHWVAGVFGAAERWVTGVFSGAGSWLVHAGEAIIHGLLSGLTSAWHDVTSFIGGIGSWISAHKGPLDYDRQLLVPHGYATMTGYAEGLQRGLDRQVAPLIRSVAPSLALPAGLARGGDGGGIALHLTYTGPQSGLIAAVVRDLRADIKARAGGNVQAHLGQGAAR